jgi:hypothetical protein
MKLVGYYDLLNTRRFEDTSELVQAWADVQAAIAATHWPHESGAFTIYPERDANGVVPIKLPCVAMLKTLGWQDECLPTIPGGVLDCGELDAMKLTPAGGIAFEWETGNISSSHRAINKLLLTLQVGGLLGGFLVVPSREMYQWLTDRVGNISELKPYFPLWKSITGAAGGLRIVVVEHDATSLSVPKIPKGKAGNAMRARRRAASRRRRQSRRRSDDGGDDRSPSAR